MMLRHMQPPSFEIYLPNYRGFIQNYHNLYLMNSCKLLSFKSYQLYVKGLCKYLNNNIILTLISSKQGRSYS